MMVHAASLADLQERARAWARENVRVSSVEEAEQLAEEAMRAVGQAVAEELVGQTAGKATYEASSRPCECGRVRSAEAAHIEEVIDGLADVGGDRSPDRLYVAMDGSHAHIDGSWHEVKTGTIFEAEPDESGLDRSGTQHYVSAQPPPSLPAC